MKIKAETGKKLRYGGMSAVLTALIVAVVIIFNVIFSLGNLVKDDFDQIYTMTNGSAALSETTEVIGTIVYKSINTPSAYSDAAAMGLMQGVVGLIIVLASNKFIKKLGIEGVF